MIIDKIDSLRAIFHNNRNDLNTKQGRSNERIRRMTLTSVAALFAQILQMAIPLITVKITLRYMGTDIYALWITVNSLFALMSYADMGLGNGLQTALSQETGRKENFNGKTIVSSSYFVLVIIAATLMLFFLILYPILDWNKIVGAEREATKSLTSRVVLAIIIPRIFSIPLSLVRRCQNAMQDGFIAYLWQGISNILSLVSIYICIALDLGSVLVIWVSSSMSIVIYVINSLSYFVKNKQISPAISFVNTAESRIMLRIGMGFFVLSLLNAIGLNLDNYIVAKADSLSSVTSYSIVLRVTQILNVACTVLSAPLWSANGEALTNGDLDWVQKVTRKMSLLSVGIVALASLVLLAVGPILFNWWLGDDIGVNRFLLLGLLLLQIAHAFISPYFMVLNASGRVRFQIGVFSIFSPISLAVKYFVCDNFGVTEMTYASFVLYSILIVIPVYISTKKQLKSKNSI